MVVLVEVVLFTFVLFWSLRSVFRMFLMVCRTAAYATFRLSVSVRLFTVCVVFLMWQLSSIGKLADLFDLSIMFTFSSLNV